jgi:hypothetical protein
MRGPRRVVAIGLSALCGLFLLTAAAGPAAARTLFVPADYATIQAGVDAATAGDTVRVAAGLYAETVTIAKPLRLLGAQADVAPSTAGRSGGESIITASRAVVILASHVTLDGFEITGFSEGVSIPGPFPAPRCERHDITLAHNWIHTAQTPVEYGVRAEPGLLQRLRIVHNRIDVLDTDATRFALAAIDLAGGLSPYGHPTYEDLTIRDNALGNLTRYGLFASADPAAYLINGLRLNGNTFEQSVISFNLGNVHDGEMNGNIVRANGGAIGMDGGEIVGNTFEKGGRLALWGTEYGFLRPSARLRVTNNEFTCEVTGRGIRYSQGVDDASITVERNAFRDSGIGPSGDGIVGYLVRNNGVGSALAALNWWGHAEGPAAATGVVFGPAVTSPCIAAYVADPAHAGRPGFWPLVTTATAITSVKRRKHDGRTTLRVAGTVTVTGLGDGSVARLGGAVAVRLGRARAYGRRLVPTSIPGAFAFAATLRVRHAAGRITATYRDGHDAFFAPSSGAWRVTGERP